MATSAKVTQVVGQVFVVTPSGEKRLLVEGDRVMAGEQVTTGEQGSVTLQLSDGREVDLGRDSSFLVADEGDTGGGAQPQDLDVDAIQAAIAAGVDPTQLLEATAAGPAAGGAGGAGGQGGGHSFVLLDRLDLRVTPNVGLDTGPLASAPLEAPAEEDLFLPDEEPPVISIAPVEPTGEAGGAQTVEGGALQFLVSLSSPSSVPVTFTWSVTLGTASAGDLPGGAVLTGTVTIPAGGTSYILSIPTFDDDIFEGGPGTFEDLVVSITDVVAAVPGNLSAAGLIEDNEVPVINLVETDLEGVGAVVVEGGELVFNVSMSEQSTEDVTFTWTLTLGSASADDLTAPITYTDTVTILAGETSAQIKVPTFDDTLFEGGVGTYESVTMTLSDPSGATLGASSSLQGLIEDNEVPVINLVETDLEGVGAVVVEGG
ncbi:MAG: retention module-containing protein, partial [Pseudomonadaceae bacterium]